MIPLQPLTLESKLFFLSAAEFGSRLFLGPGGPGGADRREWLEIVTQGPAELVNMLPDDRAPAADGDPDFALPALLARLTGMDHASMSRDLHREFDRLFTAVADDPEAAPETAGQIATDLEYLTALLAKGFFGKEPEATKKARSLCRAALAPRLTGLRERLAAKDRTGVFAAAADVMLRVVRDLAGKL